MKITDTEPLAGADSIRGHSSSLRNDARLRNDFEAAVRLNFLTNRAVPLWNALTQEAVGARDVNAFKAALDKNTKKA